MTPGFSNLDVTGNWTTTVSVGQWDNREDLSPLSFFPLILFLLRDPTCRPEPWETSGALGLPHPHILTPLNALLANSLHTIFASPFAPALVQSIPPLS